MGDAGLRTPFSLNGEQSDAVRILSGLADAGEARAALLFGVTGSGKTCVILSMIDRMLDAGRGVIMMLPEIALTPQMLAIFRARYGYRVAVIHSGLSGGERMDAYRRIRAGEAPVVVGTRSAVFAPVPHLGMIVMDEEQEHTYKSDQNPKYHARDVARFRCAQEKALQGGGGKVHADRAPAPLRKCAPACGAHRGYARRGTARADRPAGAGAGDRTEARPGGGESSCPVSQPARVFDSVGLPFLRSCRDLPRLLGCHELSHPARRL